VLPLTTDAIEGCVQALDEVGYAIVPGVVGRDVLDVFRQTIDDEYQHLDLTGAGFHGGGSFSGHLNCYPGEAARVAYEQVRDSGILDVVRATRPDLADRPRVTLNYNLPGSVAQHYHMDGVYTRDFLICNVAVVDTDLVNGALDVLPGTHQTFLPFWKYAVGRTWRRTTRVPLQQGDVVIRRSTLWHRGMPNRSSRPRQMLAVTFGEVPDVDLNPLGEHGGAVEFYPNWFRPTRLGRLRERVFVAAPISYSAYRFVRSLDGRKGYDR
jgi:hypothetical protein